MVVYRRSFNDVLGKCCSAVTRYSVFETVYKYRNRPQSKLRMAATGHVLSLSSKDVSNNLVSYGQCRFHLLRSRYATTKLYGSIVAPQLHYTLFERLMYHNLGREVSIAVWDEHPDTIL